jgi:hypothetical protein
MNMQQGHNTAHDFFGYLLVLPVMASVVIGIFVFGHQCLDWLKFGYWQEMTLQDAIYYLFGHPFFSQTGWLGTDKIIQWSIDSGSLALWLIIILPTIWVAGWYWLLSTARQLISRQ